MKAVASVLAFAALVPVALISLWALGWRDWTNVIAAVLIAAFIVVNALGQSRGAGARATTDAVPPTQEPPSMPVATKPRTRKPAAS